MDTGKHDLRDQLLNLIPRMIAEGTSITEAFAKKQNLHPTDIEALTLLGIAHTRKEPITAGALGRGLRLSSGATTFVLNRLERAGLIRRLRDQSDQRKVRLHFSASGQNLFQDFFGPALRRNHAVMDGFSGKELAIVLRFLTATTAAMAAHRQELASLN